MTLFDQFLVWARSRSSIDKEGTSLKKVTAFNTMSVKVKEKSYKCCHSPDALIHHHLADIVNTPTHLQTNKRIN